MSSHGTRAGLTAVFVLTNYRHHCPFVEVDYLRPPKEDLQQKKMINWQMLEFVIYGQMSEQKPGRSNHRSRSRVDCEIIPSRLSPTTQVFYNARYKPGPFRRHGLLLSVEDTYLD